MIELLARLFGRSEPVLSEAQQRDTAAIAALHAVSFNRGWSEEEIDRLLADRQVVTHRVAIGGRLAGFIMSRMAADEAEILSVAVAPARRGRGLAGGLLDMHLRRLAGMGVRTVFLEVGEDNDVARKLYRRAGFHEAGRREGYYVDTSGKRSTALVLQRNFR
jgi:ribosomal-protein-alanine N-acetyltransferase